MKRNPVVYARVSALCVLALLATGSTTVGPREALVREAVQDYMAAAKVVGCTVAIAEKGRLVFEEGFGYADLEHMVLAKPETVYRLASVSKPITAVAVMQLADERRVFLDDDIRKYVPEFPEKEWPFTVAQVMAHLSGIRHYNGNEFQNQKRYSSVLESLDIFKNDPLVCKPGDEYTYSTYGYTLLARLVENVSGKPFPEYLKERVFGAADMKTASVEDLFAVVPNRSRFYRLGADGKVVNSEYADMSYKWGGGGLIASAPDVCRFGIALLKGKLVSKSSLERMFTANRLNDGTSTHYGFGWNIGDLNGQRMISHSGAQQGAQAILMLFPDQDVVIAVLTNYESHKATIMGRRVALAWFSGTQR